MENKSGIIEAVQCATYSEGDWGGDMYEAAVCSTISIVYCGSHSFV